MYQWGLCETGQSVQTVTVISALAKACTQLTGQQKIPQLSPTGSFEIL